MKLTPNEVENIVSEAVKSIIKEGFWFKDNKLEGKPTNLKDLFYSDGWTFQRLPKGVFKCFTNNNSLRTREYLPFEELVEDVNIFFEDNNLQFIAKAIQAPEGEDRGSFFKVFKKAPQRKLKW